ncbi:hypothetical protein AV530_019668 [Patagioenas fasciata monilis]|uniref:Uncharacterized protein n=1 Tax=Patagioenas fasciata monilis TaxID=372326 RepID=A0A1V4JE62_PATFA|nr:hypothetical protein AV530_019668 [Patagioenas fasciata monilis]
MWSRLLSADRPELFGEPDTTAVARQLPAPSWDQVWAAPVPPAAPRQGRNREPDVLGWESTYAIAVLSGAAPEVLRCPWRRGHGLISCDNSSRRKAVGTAPLY